MLALAGCTRNAPSSPPSVSSPTSPPVAVPSTILPKDDLGREIKLAAAPRRVVSLAPGVTETIYALGAGDKLAGRDQSSDYPAAAKKLPVVGDFNGPFAEKVVALRPDLIIAQGETYDLARVELWQRKCGVPVVLLQPKSIASVQQGIEKIAAWLGVPEKSRPLVQKLGNSGRQMRKGAAFVRWPSFIEVGRTPLWSAGSDTLIGDVLTRNGLGNVARINGYKPYSAESLAKGDPEFYIVTDNKPDVARSLRELRAVSSLRGLKCIRRGRVIVVPADLVLRPGPRLAQGISEIEKQLVALEERDGIGPDELKR